MSGNFGEHPANFVMIWLELSSSSGTHFSLSYMSPEKPELGTQFPIGKQPVRQHAEEEKGDQEKEKSLHQSLQIFFA